MSEACFRQAEAQHAHARIIPKRSDEGRLLSLSTHPPPVERRSTSAVFCTADGMTTTAEWCHLSFFSQHAQHSNPLPASAAWM